MDALKVYVFGFHTQRNGKLIRKVLEKAGYTVVTTVPPDANNSGTIETNIAPDDALNGDLDAIRKAVHDLCPKAWVHWVEYKIILDGDDKGDGGPPKLHLHPA